MKTYIKVALSLVILICLAVFIRATNWTGVSSSVQAVGFNFLFLLCITFLSSWLGALSWRYCLPKESTQVSGWQLYWIRLIGENIAILNPTSIIGGEAAKIYMLTDLGINKRQALHSILLSRAIAIISQILMLIIAGAFFLSLTIYTITWTSFGGWYILGALALVSGLIMLARGRYLKGRIRVLFHWLRILETYQKLRVFLSELWLELTIFYHENRRAMFLSFLFCSLHWIVGSLEFYFILLFLGVKTTIAKALLVDMGVIVFKTAGGFIPGQIGIEEYGNKVMLVIIGIAGNTIWITASILRRARQLSWILIALLVYFVSFHRRPVLQA